MRRIRKSRHARKPNAVAWLSLKAKGSNVKDEGQGLVFYEALSWAWAPDFLLLGPIPETGFRGCAIDRRL
jgi:hypothetical protein